MIWGSSFLLIKVAGEQYTPIQIAFSRIALGAVALLAVVAVSGDRLPRGGRLWGHLTVAAIMLNVVPFTLFAVGEQYLSSILAGIWNGTTPLFAVIAGWVLLPNERATRRMLLGLIVGFAGVVTVLAPWRDFSYGDVVGQLAFMGAALCYGVGTPYLRRFMAHRQDSSISMSAAQFLIATAILAVILPVGGGVPQVGADLPTLSVVALGVIGSGFAYVLYYSVIRQAGATIASTVTYLMPIVATALGILVLHEPLHWSEPVGAAVVLSGILFGQRTRTRTED